MKALPREDARGVRRLYEALLHLYPAGFRRAYAGELSLLFVDMYRAAAAEGATAQARFWLAVLPDLAASALRERIKSMQPLRWPTVISILLCLPLLFIITMAALNVEPPFVADLNKVIIGADGTPTALGRVVMIALLLSVPAAFAINLLPMLRKPGDVGAAQFSPTTAHTIVGLAILLGLAAIFSEQAAHELRPFVTPLGAAAFLGHGLYYVLVLAAPVAFLLNRFPRLTRSGAGGTLIAQPTSINLIVGSAALLVIVLLASIFALEMTACSIGVPNCD